MSRSMRTRIKACVPSAFRRESRRWLRRINNAALGAPLTESEFSGILEYRLGIKAGDTVLVHCSFGALKATFSAEEALGILQERVGPDGSIIMPCYPGNGEEWLRSGKSFDPLTTPIATGILAQTLSRSKDARVSIHPIKAVAAWGMHKDAITADHQYSLTPFDRNSPYTRLLTLPHAKAIGLATAKMTFYHCCEDAVPEMVDLLYTPEALPGYFVTGDGGVLPVPTRVHRTEVLDRMPSSYDVLTGSGCPGYRVFRHRHRFFYVADLPVVHEHVRTLLTSRSDIPVRAV